MRPRSAWSPSILMPTTTSRASGATGANTGWRNAQWEKTRACYAEGIAQALKDRDADYCANNGMALSEILKDLDQAELVFARDWPSIRSMVSSTQAWSACTSSGRRAPG